MCYALIIKRRGTGNSYIKCWDNGADMPLTNHEAGEIANIIAPIFDKVVADYDFAKYPAEDYKRFKNEFSALNENNGLIEEALVWKWGHWGKSNYPRKHRSLVAETEVHWASFVNSDAVINSEQTFSWWRTTYNRRTTYIILQPLI